MKMTRSGAILLFWVLALGTIAAAEESNIEAIRVIGNSRVEQNAIRVRVRSEIGKPPDPAIVEQDVRSIYGMGFFEDVQASVDDVDGKRTLTFHVVERPMIREVKLEGNKKIKRGRSRGRPQDPAAHDARRREDSARHRGRQEALRREGLPGRDDHLHDFGAREREVTLTLHVNEGKIIRIQKIVFEGNHEFSSAS